MLSALLGDRPIFTVPAEMNPLAADKVNGNKFYLYFFGKMMVSEDGGLTFVQKYARAFLMRKMWLM